MRKGFTSVIILATHVAAVALAVFLRRPGDIAFPGFAFFAGFSALPCLMSWLAANRFGITSLRKAVVSLLAALAAFCITWLLQLYAVAQYALAQSNSRVEGVISNFYVFTGLFLPRGLLVAGLVLLVIVALDKGDAQHARA